MTWKNIMKYLVTIVILGSFLLTGIAALAQSSTNKILLEIPRVTKNGETLEVEKSGTNNWVFDGTLTLDDEIRYRWNAVSIDLSYRDFPTAGGGWLKVYKDDDTKEENLLFEHGSSPIPTSLFKDKLEKGPNKVIVVYIDSTTKAPAVPLTKVGFSFDFDPTTTRPQISIATPKPGIVLANGINHEFKLELLNYRLSSTTKPEDGIGKMNIYYNEVKTENFIATINNSVEQESGSHFVVFDSEDIDFNKIPDSENLELIFVLTNVTGDTLPFEARLQTKTNFNNSINVGLPRLAIVEPRKDRIDQSVDGNQKFLLQVDNFELLQDFETGSEVDGKRGYLQIFVDNTPVKTVWPKPEFSFNELGAIYDIEGQRTVKVQLVNPDFTKLAPEATDSLTVLYMPAEDEREQSTLSASTNDGWRYVIIALVLMMIVGGILLLVTKG